MSDGAAAERELSDTLEDEHRYAAMPAGGSGAGTDRARPDVLAVRRSCIGVAGGSTSTLAIEVKRRSDGLCHLDHDEITALQSFASRAGGTPLVVVRPDRRRWDQDWHCYRTQDLNKTDGGHWSIRQHERPGRPLDEVVGRV